MVFVVTGGIKRWTNRETAFGYAASTVWTPRRNAQNKGYAGYWHFRISGSDPDPAIQRNWLSGPDPDLVNL